MTPRARAWSLTAGRVVNTTFFLFTSVYCALTSSPFAYEQFIQPHVIAWLANFVFLFASLYWLSLCVTALTLVPVLQTPRLRLAAGLYLGIGAAVGAAVTVRNVLPGGDSAAQSLTMAMAALVPLVALGALDRAAAHRPQRPEAPLHRVCALTAAFVWATYAGLAIVRLRAAGGMIESGGALAVGLALSAVAHLIAFTVLFGVLTLIAALASRVGMPRRFESRARLALWIVAAAIVLQRVVFAPIAIVGSASWCLAAAMGGALVISIAGIASLHADVPPSRAAAGAAIIALPAAAFAALAVVTTFDWGFMLQKLSALAIAAAAFAAFRIVAAGAGPARPRRPLALPIAALVAVAVSAVAAPRLSAWTGDPRLDPAFAVDAYSAGDPSFRLLRQFLEPAQALRRDAEFFSFLRRNTSVQAAVAPVAVDFVPQLPPAVERPPDIFLFLIDSLRRDYLAPYNDAVTFTPAFQAFAADSIVFERAFTRYGGTGLAVPAVWAGAMLIHKQYVTPFAPTNALAKLLDASGYRRAVSFDHITDELFGFPEGSTVLDRAVPEMMHTFCGTVGELEADIRAHAADSRPLFAHTRPLDLHIGNTRLAQVPAGESYPGFFGPYAARVRRIDACFGEFLAFLKSVGRYDDSVIIVMSDHGDSLGEGLRWGHGYTVFPEVIRIPLMIHLPARLRGRFVSSPAHAAFSTDVTPTLYALLGQAPVRPRLAAGSPLLAPRGESLPDRTSESFLVASSYGAVYGLVQQDGRRLYVADAIEGHEYLFDLHPSGRDVRLGLTDAEREADRARVRAQVADLADWYRR